MLGLTMIALLVTAAPAGASTRDFPEYTPVDREITDRALLDALDSTGQALGAVVEARERNDHESARALLAGHFRQRRTPVLPKTTFPGGHAGNSMVVVQGSKAHQKEADEKWLRHIYTSRNNDEGTTETYQLGTPVDWYANPSTCFTWMIYLNQLNVVSKLAGVWRDTGDDRYALEAGHLVESWVKQCWRGYCYVRDGKMTNSGMEVRNRLCNCIAAYDVLRTCPALTPEMHMAFWKLFVSHARDLVEWAPGGSHKNALVAYPGLIAVAVMFPEFAESADWMEAGLRSLRDSIVDRVTPEGAWHTHSTAYQSVPYAWSLRSLELLQANSDEKETSPTADLIRIQITRMMELQFQTALPNGGWPNVGDSYGRHDWGCALSSVLDMYVWLRFNGDQQVLLNRISDPYERMLAALAAAKGAALPLPLEASVGLTGSGYYTMRSGWSGRQQRYLYFDLTPQAYGHVHYDAGHVEAYAYGKPLVTDTGDYFLGWGARTALHNTIEVDGGMQTWGAEMVPCEWLTMPWLDVADGAHCGYSHRGITHRRKVLFVKGDMDGFTDYWLLTDLLTGTGEHTYEQFFHLAGPDPVTSPTVDLDPETLVASTSHANTANVTVIPACLDGLQGSFFEPIESDMDPKAKTERAAMLGWMVSTGTFQRIPSPALVYQRTGVPPQSYHTMLLPTPTGAHATATLDLLPVTRAGVAMPTHEAAGLRCSVALTRRVHASAETDLDFGPNLARGCPAIASINTGSFGTAAGARLTDGARAPNTVGGGASSSPYQPGVPLTAEFVIDLGKKTAVNHLIVHDGIWNGSKTLYPASAMRIRHAVLEGAWTDLVSAQQVRKEPYAVHVRLETAVVARWIAVSVDRPEGGRIAVREIEAYRVADAERTRIKALQAQTVTERWSDVILVSHSTPVMTRYGDFTFDGQFAVLRYDGGGQLTKMSCVRGTTLMQGSKTVISTDTIRDLVTATWSNGLLRLEGPACEGVKIATGSAIEIAVAGHKIPCRPEDVLQIPVSQSPQLTINDANVELHPPQKGLAGGQPWATMTWHTDSPATSQVEFRSTEGPLRRTPFLPHLTRSHSCRVDFLLPDHTYEFTAISCSPSGARTTHPIPSEP
ncbi:MAG: alginate lyase family protein [Lentisphaerae bacterium]|jgi:hypothetical protein|nr:alginate lyase family protein [Lentisphaerota bacterium]MBT4815564.1 alginate lyase family protein [Lentisphaerota bacterium]MBT5613203.1 alginate lyase family protein [Lentisphaerota bacterium]MBT7062134.1 alginate lyase family protein [Lentisphaerota bacterium]MBT7847646.1 alginate lyase family protein [Lentisphaerota bacterium]